MMEEPRRRGVLQDLIFTNIERLIGEVKVESSLGCSDDEMVETRILRAGRRVKGNLTTLEFKRADFDMVEGLLGRVPEDKTLEGRGAQESCLIFKDHLLQAQEWSIPTNK